jgi:hypothetical protein
MFPPAEVGTAPLPPSTPPMLAPGCIESSASETDPAALMEVARMDSMQRESGMDRQVSPGLLQCHEQQRRSIDSTDTAVTTKAVRIPDNPETTFFHPTASRSIEVERVSTYDEAANGRKSEVTNGTESDWIPSATNYTKGSDASNIHGTRQSLRRSGTRHSQLSRAEVTGKFSFRESLMEQDGTVLDAMRYLPQNVFWTRYVPHWMREPLDKLDNVAEFFSRSCSFKACGKRSKTSCAHKALDKIAFIQDVFTILDFMILIWSIQDATDYVKNNPNAIVTGVPDQVVVLIFTDIFAFTYLSTVLLRLYTERCSFCKNFFEWRVFNLPMAIAFTCQAFAQHANIDERGSSRSRNFFTVLATFRILRVFQVLHKMTAELASDNLVWVQELHCILEAMHGSLWSLMWSALTVMTTFTMVAVIFAEGALQHCVQNFCEFDEEKEGPRSLERYFGTFSRSLLSLSQAISGGEDWANIYSSLAPLHWFYRALFLGFICFTVLALMNVVTAVFVDSIMARSKNDRALIARSVMKSEQNFLRTMKDMFTELDKDASGEIDLNELERHMQEPKMDSLLKGFGVDVKHVSSFFKLLDVDKSGSIDMLEFMRGLERLKGEAKTLDIALLHEDVRWVGNTLISLLHAGGWLEGNSSDEYDSDDPGSPTSSGNNHNQCSNRAPVRGSMRGSLSGKSHDKHKLRKDTDDSGMGMVGDSD